jgi:hypothetical protein
VHRGNGFAIRGNDRIEGVHAANITPHEERSS